MHPSGLYESEIAHPFPTTPAPAVDAWALVNRLRDQEADSVTILCDNADGPPNNAIECCGFWTGFAERRFDGDTIIVALQSAVAAKDQADKDGHPPALPAVDAVPAGEVERFVIRRNGAFFRPNAQGYTTHIVAAGFYTREEADNYANVEGVTIEPLERYRAEAERTIAEANRLLAALSHGEGRK